MDINVIRELKQVKTTRIYQLIQICFSFCIGDGKQSNCIGYIVPVKNPNKSCPPGSN